MAIIIRRDENHDPLRESREKETRGGLPIKAAQSVAVFFCVPQENGMVWARGTAGPAITQPGLREIALGCVTSVIARAY